MNTWGYTGVIIEYPMGWEFEFRRKSKEVAFCSNTEKGLWSGDLFPGYCMEETSLGELPPRVQKHEDLESRGNKAEQVVKSTVLW